jgi:hypothetical protein
MEEDNMTITTYFKTALTCMLCASTLGFTDIDAGDLGHNLGFETASPDQTGTSEMQILENAFDNDAGSTSGGMRVLSISDDGDVEGTHFAGMGSGLFGDLSGSIAVVILDEDIAGTDDTTNIAGHGQWANGDYKLRLGVFSTDDGTTETQITRLNGETYLVDNLTLKAALSMTGTDDGTGEVDTTEMQLEGEYALGNGFVVGLILNSFENNDATGTQISEEMAYGFGAHYTMEVNDDIDITVGGKYGKSDNTLADNSTVDVVYTLGNAALNYNGDNVSADILLALQEMDDETTVTTYNIANANATLSISDNLKVVGRVGYISQEDDDTKVLTEQHITVEAHYQISDDATGVFLIQQRDIDDLVDDSDDEEKTTLGIGATYSFD